MLKVIGGVDYKGFLLEQPLEIEGRIVVLTGKNGGGKTRFLESIRDLASRVFCGDNEIEKSNIVFLAQSALVPAFGMPVDDYSHVAGVRRTIEYFVRNRQEFNEPYDQNKDQHHMMYSRGIEGRPALSYGKLHNLCRIVSERLSLPVDKLDVEHIRVHFDEVLDSPFGSGDISLISNSYRRRLYENEFNAWRASRGNKEISFVEEDEVDKVFGPKPWDLINSILEMVFDKKFIFSVPDEESEVFDYVAQLMLKDSGEFLGPDSLSSGEKTLLWLAITLFNTQYRKTLESAVPKLLLIDEPDAFLHPKMVEKLYTFLNLFTTVFDAFVVVTTHSPTTVALAPSSVYVVDEGRVVLVDKDLAISELLDGVGQISIDPENRLNVFVESFYDANLFSVLYAHVRGVEAEIDSKVSLSFIPSGETVPSARIVDAMRSLVSKDQELISNVVQAINGVGSCSHVYGAVEKFTDVNSKYVRGVVDWDLKNKPAPGVVVFAENYAYTTENIALDPISILLLLHLDKGIEYSMFTLCGEDVPWTAWICRLDLLQTSLDRFVERVLGSPSQRDVELEYISGVKLLTDKRYLFMDGALERMVIAAYKGLNSYLGNGPKKDLAYTVVTKSMLKITGGRFIPVQFVQMFKKLQVSRPR
ncbi:ATP-binding protein [Pseudomonas sp. NFACC08-1]|uniref:ATP-binding protein n=1 Tax=Pseudomonas sp. NFACC08-1 TaxID=1566238 RepID=UPI000894A10A|nr:ATP-binding protein [Pseudomonas sp. NFACC08-1]SDX78035.1 AAA domain-containing protein, putative AbiEii toxin, Type IV TA system [Pseudomonas sp. NFACC08-1]